MRTVAWWPLVLLVACGKSESRAPWHANDAGSAGDAGASAGSTLTTAGSGGSTGGAGGSGASSGGAGRSGASGGPNTAGAGATPSAGGSAGSAGAGSSAGGAPGGGSGAGGSGGTGGADAGSAGMGAAGAPGEECGEYTACGCGCCGGTEPTQALCYYPERGDTLADIRAADAAVASDPSCANAGCSLGTRRVCCETPADDNGKGSYRATGYSGGLDHLSIFREDPAGRCAALELAAPSGSDRTFGLELPRNWGVTTMAVGDCNENGVPTSTGRVAIGAVGSVTFVDEACTLAIDATLFFLTDSGEVDAVRLLAPNVPATGGPLPPCR